MNELKRNKLTLSPVGGGVTTVTGVEYSRWKIKSVKRQHFGNNLA